MDTKKYIGKNVFLLNGQKGIIRSIDFLGGKTRITVKVMDESNLANWKTFSIDEIGVSIFPSYQQLQEHLEIKRSKSIEQRRAEKERKNLPKYVSQSKNHYQYHVEPPPRKTLPSIIIPKVEVVRQPRLMTVSECQQVSRILKERNIFELIHFTHVENLPTILEFGLLPLEDQKTYYISSHHSDASNHFRDAISLSISFPNFKMFYAKHLGMTSDWAVITLSPDILFENRSKVLFCYENAARFMYEIPEDPEKFIGPKAFNRMFCKNLPTYTSKSVSREELAIPSNYTTDPQAEILYHGKIPVSKIEKIQVSHESTYRKLIQQVGIDKCNLLLSDSMFRPRIDYTFWKKVNESGK